MEGRGGCTTNVIIKSVNPAKVFTHKTLITLGAG